MTPHTARLRADFDDIARLADPGASGTDRYDRWLVSLVPVEAIHVLDVGCGLGRLTGALATGDRQVVGIDLSPVMVERATREAGSRHVSFILGDVLEMDFGGKLFDCVLSTATLHHLPQDLALQRLKTLVRPGGRLIIQDLRRDSTALDRLRAYTALAHTVCRRFARTGRLRPARPVRLAWARHGAQERYLSLTEVQTVATRFLPGSRVFNHWLWRYTITWDKPEEARGTACRPTKVESIRPNG